MEGRRIDTARTDNGDKEEKRKRIKPGSKEEANGRQTDRQSENEQW